MIIRKLILTKFTSLFYSEKEDFIATGGRGDKAIFVYKSSNEGKFNRLFKLQGHTGLYNQSKIQNLDSVSSNLNKMN